MENSSTTKDLAEKFGYLVLSAAVVGLIWYLSTRGRKGKDPARSTEPPESTDGPGVTEKPTDGPVDVDETPPPDEKRPADKSSGLPVYVVVLLVLAGLAALAGLAFFARWIIRRRRDFTGEHSEAVAVPASKRMSLTDVPGDGLCLFHSVAEGIKSGEGNSTNTALTLARSTADEMERLARKEKDSYIKSSIVSEAVNIRDWIKYAEKKPATPDHFPDLQQAGQALSNVTKMDIVFYDRGLNKRFEPFKPATRDAKTRTIGVYRSGNHFQHWRNP